MKIDLWEFPECCIKCGHYDNEDRNRPITLLDVPTKLCPDCFSNLHEDD